MIMVRIGLLLWGLFFIMLGFSMMPGYITFVIVISFIGGLIDGIRKYKMKKKEQIEKWVKRDEDIDYFSPVW